MVVCLPQAAVEQETPAADQGHSPEALDTQDRPLTAPEKELRR